MYKYLYRCIHTVARYPCLLNFIQQQKPLNKGQIFSSRELKKIEKAWVRGYTHSTVRYLPIVSLLSLVHK